MRMGRPRKGRWNSRTFWKFVDEFPDLSLEEILDRFKEYFSFEKCIWCWQPLGSVDFSEVPYLDFLVHYFVCVYCKTPLLKVYSKDGKFVSYVDSQRNTFMVSRERQILKKCYAYHLFGNMLELYPFPDKYNGADGCPLPTSKDYEETVKQRKYDYKAVDRILWKGLNDIECAERGLKSDVLRSYLNYFLRAKCSTGMILDRLNDIEIRGRVHKFNYLVGGTWKNFWVKSQFDPRLFFMQYNDYLDWDVFVDFRPHHLSMQDFWTVRCHNCGKENKVEDYHVEYVCEFCGFVNRHG
jgi:hypothetical protein